MAKALFLDRDGVINIDRGYVYRIDDFEFLPGIFAFCRSAMINGYRIVVVTNQSGIGRGYYSEDDFLRLTHWMKGVFAENDVALDHVYYCPHHPSHARGHYQVDCQCRKPKPGMLNRAVEELGLDASRCLMVGDSQTDIEAAQAAGIRAIKVECNQADYLALSSLLF
ncbi:MAG TPA: D-glycero-beta-D-manno-heptose 1,7-bisphosphate 7-phosphatase [Marinagarivorans sp.]